MYLSRCIAVAVAVEVATGVHSMCGVRNLNVALMVVGGSKTGTHEFPWQVSIQKYVRNLQKPQWIHICGGSVLSERWILTAAHCITFDLSSTPVKIVAGVTERYAQTDGKQTSNVSRVISHPLFNVQGVQNDIALFELSEPLKLDSSTVSPICLPTNNSQTFEGLTCVATGWGKTSEFGYESEALLQVSLPVVASTVCQDRYKKVIKTALETFATTKLCAGRTDQFGYGVCQGDSGGPLACPVDNAEGGELSKNVFVVAGVNSFAKKCGSPAYPPVFTRVSHYLEWIHDVTKM